MKLASVVVRLFAVLAALMVAGCSTPTSRITANPADYKKLTPDQQARVRAGQPSNGFDEAAVRLALGEPDQVSTKETAGGTDTVWHYATYESDGRFLFTGSYHAGRAWWGGPYPDYYLDYPNRHVRDRFRVVFRNGRVTTIVNGDVD